jgi:hypothetical protein
VALGWNDVLVLPTDDGRPSSWPKSARQTWRVARESRIDTCSTSPRAEASHRDARALLGAPRGRYVYHLRARFARAAQRVETVRRLGSTRARKTETRRKSARRPIASRVFVRGSAERRVGR